jgi:hypothetical protein
MAERLREVAEIPQQFIKEGTLVCHLINLCYLKLMNSSLIDVRNLPRMVCLPSTIVPEWIWTGVDEGLRLTSRIPTIMSSHRCWILSNGIHRLPSQVNPYSNVSALSIMLKAS